MNIFQKVARETQSRKNTDSPGFISRFLSGTALWPDNDYRSNALEGYKKSWIAYKCIHLRSQAVSRLPLKVYKKLSNGEEEYQPEHELQTLLDKPNPFYSKQTLLELWEMSRCLSGKAFFQLARLGIGDIPDHMYYMRPDKMKIIPDKETYIKGYEYVLDTDTLNYKPEQIIFFRIPDPLDDYDGQAPLEAGMRTISTDNKITEWNKVYFDNAARPEGAFVVDGNLQEDSFNRIDGEFRKKYTGVENRGKPLLLEGGVKWEQISNTHKDMDFRFLKTMTRQDICDLLGVPTALISNRKEDGGTYNNTKEAKTFFWENTVLLEGEDLVQQLNSDLAVRYGDDIFIKIDTSEIPALKENAKSLEERINKKVENNIIKINEARMELGYEEEEWAETTLAELQALINQRGLQTNNKTIQDMSEVKQLLMKVNQTLESVKKNDKKQELIKEYKDLFNEEEIKAIENNIFDDDITYEQAKYWFEYVKQLNPFEDEFNDLVTRLFTEQEKIVLDNLNSEKALTKDISESDIDDILFQLDEQQEYFFLESEPIFRNTVQVFGSEALQSVGMSIDFDLENPRVAEYLQDKTFQFSTQINETTIESIRSQLIEGIQAGEGIPELARRIENVYKDAKGYRSRLIARTETLSSSNQGALEGYIQSGVTSRKEWISALDSRTRDAHREANGQIVGIDEDFIVDGFPMSAPGDISAPANLICNCRCTLAPIVDN